MEQQAPAPQAVSSQDAEVAGGPDPSPSRAPGGGGNGGGGQGAYTEDTVSLGQQQDKGVAAEEMADSVAPVEVPSAGQNAPDLTASLAQDTAQAAQAPSMTPEQRAESSYQEMIDSGVPSHTAWVVAREGAGLDTAGQEGEQHQQGMREELSGSADGITIAQELAQHLGQNEKHAAASAMDALAAAYRDSRASDGGE